MSTYEQFVLIGEAKGEIKGKIEGKIEVIKNLVKRGFTIIEIADITDLPIEDVKKHIEHIEKEEMSRANASSKRNPHL